MIERIIEKISSIFWGPATITFVIFVGAFLTLKLRFFQVLKIRVWLRFALKEFFSKNGTQSYSGISKYQALTTALASAIGTGNIVGVATAISLGGPGAIFWMWIAAFFGMMTMFTENILAVMYRQKNKDGVFFGGPMYYMQKGVKSNVLANIFSISCILATFGIGNLAQSNSIASAVLNTFNVKKKETALVLAFISGIVIFGGIKRIAKITERLVPLMAIFYIIGGASIIIFNIKNLPFAFKKIFEGAFCLKSFAGAASGVGIKEALKYGVSRGIFSNEAGLGSSPIVHASAETQEPITQGLLGIFQIFIDTFIVCNITAFCILTTQVPEKFQGVDITISAFKSLFGNFGGVFICIATVLFAFATIISWSYYGEKSLEFISKGKCILFYRAVYVVAVMFGCSLNIGIVWDIADIFNACMCITNLTAVLILSNKVVKYVREGEFSFGDKKNKI